MINDPRTVGYLIYISFPATDKARTCTHGSDTFLCVGYNKLHRSLFQRDQRASTPGVRTSDSLGCTAHLAIYAGVEAHLLNV